jgi:pantoate--beta-alanine ligase
MLIIKHINQVKKIIGLERHKGLTIGFVPTMGALHKGHLSLVRIARKKCDLVVVSIFVNPTQFGPKEDYKRYPRDLKRDQMLLKGGGADIIFYPAVKGIYPHGYRTFIEVQGWSGILCGASRPGHFRGVATVVLKLFNIIRPHIAIFGKKDFQQLLIIKKMVKDLNMDIRIIAAPTIRERNGLAMSSRNKYLTEKERGNAAVIIKSLRWAKRSCRKKQCSVAKALRTMKKMIKNKGGRVDYIRAVDAENLTDVKRIQKGVLIAAAVYFGKTRLIDNIVV